MEELKKLMNQKNLVRKNDLDRIGSKLEKKYTNSKEQNNSKEPSEEEFLRIRSEMDKKRKRDKQ